MKDMSYEEWKNKYIPRLEEGMPVKLALSGNIYANSTDQLAVNAKKIKPIDGFTDIVAHGDEYSIVFKDTRGNEENVSAAEFAEILQASGGYKGGNIRLFACSTGAGEGIVPQYLADKLGVDILAPTEDITVFKDGSFIVANDDTDAIMGIETGKWKLFKPRKRK